MTGGKAIHFGGFSIDCSPRRGCHFTGCGITCTAKLGTRDDRDDNRSSQNATMFYR